MKDMMANSADRPHYQLETAGIRISVAPDYLEDESAPDDDHFVWAYTVRINNLSDDAITLRRRRWQITDASGHTAVVTGDGVVGEQPTLEPGDAFEYTSGCPLNTPSGMMVGSFSMETASGNTVEIPIPAFSLDSPFGWRRPN